MLGFVVYQGVTDDGVRSSVAGGEGALPAGRALRFAGVLPAGLFGEAFEPIVAGQQPDITFSVAAGGAGAPARYFALVAAFSLGIDALTFDQLRGLLSAAIRNAGDVGGTSGAVQFWAAGGEDFATVLAFAGGTPDKTFESGYAALLSGMSASGSRAFAFVPLELVRPSVVAVAIDGNDLVRGRGDPAAWPFIERLTLTAGSSRGRDALPAIAARLRPALPPVTRVVATGDILQSRCTLAKIEASGDWGSALRGRVGEYLAAADLALGSLDGSIQDISEPYRCIATTNLSSPPRVIEALTLAGIDGVTVATNHVFDCGDGDCGSRALLRTIELLGTAGIRTVGGGRMLEEALASAVFEVNGLRIGVLGFDDVAAYALEATATAAGTAPLDDSYADENASGEPAFFRPASELSLTRFTERIRRLKAEVDIVIVQVQTGTEDTHTPSERSIKALRAAADAGADLVVGNQAHWVQAVEARGSSFIAYALGNFIFDQLHTPEHTQGFLLEATFAGKKLVTVRLVPYRIVDQHRPEFVDGALRAKILGDVLDAAALLPPR